MGLADLPVEILGPILEDVVSVGHLYGVLELRLVHKIFDELVLEAVIKRRSYREFLSNEIILTAVKRRLLQPSRWGFLEPLDYLDFLATTISAQDPIHDISKTHVQNALASALVYSLPERDVTFRVPNQERIMKLEQLLDLQKSTKSTFVKETISYQSPLKGSNDIRFTRTAVDVILRPRVALSSLQYSDISLRAYHPCFGNLIALGGLLGSEETMLSLLALARFENRKEDETDYELLKNLLAIASAKGYIMVVEIIVLELRFYERREAFDVSIGPLIYDFEPAVIKAASNGYWRPCQVFIEASSVCGLLTIEVAARHGHETVVQNTLASLRLPNIRRKCSRMPGKATTILALAASSGNLLLVQKLTRILESYTIIDQRIHLITALQTSIIYNYEDIFKYLFRGLTKIFPSHMQSWTTGDLRPDWIDFMSVLGGRGSYRILDIALQEGLSIPEEDELTKTLLYTAAKAGDVTFLKRLKDCGVSDDTTKYVWRQAVGAVGWKSYSAVRTMQKAGMQCTGETADISAEDVTNPKVFLVSAFGKERERQIGYRNTYDGSLP